MSETKFTPGPWQAERRDMAAHRDSAVIGGYWSEMRELANEVKAELRKSE